MNCNNKGFSILEYIIVLAIIGIMLATSPLRAKTIEAQNLKNTANLIIKDMDRYSNLARWYETIFSINFDKELSRYTIETAQNSINLQRPLPKGISIYKVKSGKTTSPNSLKLYPSGVVSPGSVTLKSKNYSCSIFQGLRGARRVECSE